MYMEWYYAEGMLLDKRGGKKIGDHLDSGDWLCVVNPNADRDAEITVTVFYEDMPPREHRYVMPAQRAGNIALHAIEGLLVPNKHYGVRVSSTVPIIAQETRGEYMPDDPVTNAMGSVILQPGPLSEKDQELWYVDGIILGGGNILEESEWLAVLNPGPKEAHLELTIFHNEKPPSKWQMAVQPERVRVIKMDDLPFVTIGRLFSVRIISDVPIVAEEVRRAWERGKYECARSMFTVMCIPLHMPV